MNDLVVGGTRQRQLFLGLAAAPLPEQLLKFCLEPGIIIVAFDIVQFDRALMPVGERSEGGVPHPDPRGHVPPLPRIDNTLW